MFLSSTNLSWSIIQLGDEQTEIFAWGNMEEVANYLGILLSSACIPEDDTVVNFVWLAECIYYRV